MSFRLLSRLFPARPKASPEQARQLQEQGAILLDVREGPEWRAGHAPGATHIPLSRLPARIKDLPPGRMVITVCRSGHRSAGAAALLVPPSRIEKAVASTAATNRIRVHTFFMTPHFIPLRIAAAPVFGRLSPLKHCNPMLCRSRRSVN